MTTHTVMNIVGTLALLAALIAQGVRWLRVLQREHYEPAAMARFLLRWSTPPVASARVWVGKNQRPLSLSLLSAAAFVVALCLSSLVGCVLATAFYGLVCPSGLSLRGRTSPLVWTRRLRTTSIVAGVLTVVVGAVGVLAHEPWWGALAAVWAVPFLLDATTRLLQPWERRQSAVFVDRAARRLAQVAPTVVGITGSFGKTSTKNHLADLFRVDGDTVATPKSFNNRAGLSRAINEGLIDGTRVFIAEMGTYGPGEIAELCAWCPPAISVITAIGPVHLERMKSLDTIESAKFEITTSAAAVVVNVDDERLRHWPARLAGKTVRTAGSVQPADVQVRVEGDHWVVVIDGESLATIAPIASVQPTNVACAIATALLLGRSATELIARLDAIAPVANRANVVTAASGVVVIDDTFNANPASAAASLRLLADQAVTGRRVVVTPGLIELGPEQYRENRALAAAVRAMGAELVIVQRTNAQALSDGCGAGAMRVRYRDDAVAWVRATLRAGDAVLYLNDLPDHYI